MKYTRPKTFSGACETIFRELNRIYSGTPEGALAELARSIAIKMGYRP